MKIKSNKKNVSTQNQHLSLQYLPLIFNAGIRAWTEARCI